MLPKNSSMGMIGFYACGLGAEGLAGIGTPACMDRAR
jgi:hypothetical protein